MKLYDELTDWYHLLDPREDHEDEAALLGALLQEAGVPASAELLELGCGAGNNASYLRDTWRCTLTDLSPRMLALSEAQNPGCPHHLGDMRTLRLGRSFDAVLLHDALCYLLTEDDLRAAAHTAWVHLRPGGVALFSPDCLAEGFEEWTEESDATDGDRTLRSLAWAWDPDPTDTTYAVDYAFMLREGGSVRVVHDHHKEGLFPRATWEAILAEAGFEVHAARCREEEVEGTSYTPYVFVARRPAAG
jgi:SAM-dependent methyltransferase